MKCGIQFSLTLDPIRNRAPTIFAMRCALLKSRAESVVWIWTPLAGWLQVPLVAHLGQPMAGERTTASRQLSRSRGTLRTADLGHKDAFPRSPPDPEMHVQHAGHELVEPRVVKNLLFRCSARC